RYKLALVLIIPLVTALVFGSLRAVSELDDAADFNETVTQVEVSQQVAVVVHELQRERTLMVTAMSSSWVDPDVVNEQTPKVDTEVTRLRERVARSEERRVGKRVAGGGRGI